MARYEVTIPYKDGTYYSVEAISSTKHGAINAVMAMAKKFGFAGKHNKPFATVIK